MELLLPVLWDLWTVQNSLLELRRAPRLAAAPWVSHITAQSELKLGGIRESAGTKQVFGKSETHYYRGERSPENFWVWCDKQHFFKAFQKCIYRGLGLCSLPTVCWTLAKPANPQEQDPTSEKGKEKPQPWPSHSPARASAWACKGSRNCGVWSTHTPTLPAPGGACPTGTALGYQLVEIRVSPLSLGLIQSCHEPVTIGVTQRYQKQDLDFVATVKRCFFCPSLLFILLRTHRVTIISRGPWACSQGCGMRGSLKELFNPQLHTKSICTHQPKSGRTQAQNTLDWREWKSKKENQAWSRSKRRNLPYNIPTWLTREGCRETTGCFQIRDVYTRTLTEFLLIVSVEPLNIQNIIINPSFLQASIPQPVPSLTSPTKMTDWL